MSRKTEDRHLTGFLRFLSFVSFIAAIVFIVLLVLSYNERIQSWYATYLNYLTAAEQGVRNLEDKVMILFVILFLFAFKGFFPIYLYPLSALCAITSTVFPAYFSLPINLLGVAILHSIKYYWGRRVGANGVTKLFALDSRLQALIEHNGKGNPWLLALLRLVPCVPVNLVSKLYGAMKFRYRDFIILSLVGFTPLLISYTFIGKNVFNPLSAPFLVPFILLFLLIGISTLVMSRILKNKKPATEEK